MLGTGTHTLGGHTFTLTSLSLFLSLSLSLSLSPFLRVYTYTYRMHRYNLHAKAVLHTVGPMGIKPDALRAAYRSALDQAVGHGLKTVALCALSTGIFGYDVRKATPVAMAAVRGWLEEGENKTLLSAIIFCTFSNADTAIYKSYMPLMFPTTAE